MRQYEPADSGFSRYLPALTRMQMDRVRQASREGTIQHCEIDVSTETHEAVAVLRIAGIGQSFPAIFDSIPEAMEIVCVGHSAGNYGGLSYCKGAIGHFFEMNCEWRMREAWQGREQGSEESLCAAGADHREWWSSSSLVFCKDHGVEEIGDEIGEVIGVVMGEENMSNPMSVHAGF